MPNTAANYLFLPHCSFYQTLNPEFHWLRQIAPMDFLDAITKAEKLQLWINSTESQAWLADKELFSFGNGI